MQDLKLQNMKLQDNIMQNDSLNIKKISHRRHGIFYLFFFEKKVKYKI